MNMAARPCALFCAPGLVLSGLKCPNAVRTGVRSLRHRSSAWGELKVWRTRATHMNLKVYLVSAPTKATARRLLAPYTAEPVDRTSGEDAYHNHWTSYKPRPPAKEEEIATVTPMRDAFVLRRGADGAHEVATMRWGFLDRSGKGPVHIHARGETAHELPTFRDAFQHRRGVVMVDTFNEGEEIVTARRAKKTKQYVIAQREHRPMAIAVLGGVWRSAEGAVETFVMVTTPPNRLIGTITDRMPAMLTHNTLPVWLEGTPDEARAVLETFEDGGAWEMAPQGTPPQLPI